MAQAGKNESVVQGTGSGSGSDGGGRDWDSGLRQSRCTSGSVVVCAQLKRQQDQQGH